MRIKIPFLTRLLEIKEEQIEIEHAKLKYLHDIRDLLNTEREEKQLRKGECNYEIFD